jgi:hypothetical protein
LASIAARRVAGVRAELVFLVLVASNPFMLTTLPLVASYTAPVAVCLGAWLLGSSGRRTAFLWISGIALGLATGSDLRAGGGVARPRRHPASLQAWRQGGGVMNVRRGPTQRTPL